ncbi:MAG: carbohydrate binding domain-containing protein [Candidatus Omnitrophica bacterium]|nr:carbohydrate binding domain-containing protein [Candidatus Omnitrophota bacterium]
MNKSLLSAIIIAIIGLFGTPLMAQEEELRQNIIANHSFEEGGVSEWSTWQVSALVLDTEAQSGCCSVKSELIENVVVGGLVQNLGAKGVSGGDTIEAGVWIKTRNLKCTNAFLKIEFFNDNWVATGEAIESSPVVGDSDWCEVSVKGTVPEGSTKVNFILGLWKYAAVDEEGDAYFDNAYAYVVEDGVE